MDQEWEVVCYSPYNTPRVRVMIVLACDASMAIGNAANQGANYSDVVCVRLRGLW